jgi:hypothetical protein
MEYEQLPAMQELRIAVAAAREEMGAEWVIRVLRYLADELEKNDAAQ